LIDSAGLQVYGAGRLEAKHGAKARRKWRKLHLAVNAAVTDQDADDPSQLAPLLDQIDGPIDRVTAGGAYDGAPTYETIAKHDDEAWFICGHRVIAVRTSGNRGREPETPIVPRSGRCCAADIR
jgi:hypothetical protein